MRLPYGGGVGFPFFRRLTLSLSRYSIWQLSERKSSCAQMTSSFHSDADSLRGTCFFPLSSKAPRSPFIPSPAKPEYTGGTRGHSRASRAIPVPQLNTQHLALSTRGHNRANISNRYSRSAGRPCSRIGRREGCLPSRLFAHRRDGRCCCR